jgi:hypothetical protein
MATIAVFVALGGGAYAAIKLPRNSVGAAQIKPNAVGASELKNKSLGVKELSPTALGTLRGATGAKGDKGDPGAPGSTGAPGAVAKWSSATVDTSQGKTTASGSLTPFSDLATPGPQVTVSVPASGLVELFAEANLSATSNAGGAVGLSVDGATNLVGCFGTFSGTGELIDVPVGTTAVGATAGGSECGVMGGNGLPSSVMVRVAPGSHTFKLVYAADSNSGTSATLTFSHRHLQVAPRP